MNIDLQKIQIKHKKSQNDAFEELCCELFLSKGQESNWDNRAEFSRKNGAGGDAGVESYWRFDNNEEYGMQAKFSDKLESSMWSQINKSVETALDKHHKLTKYYIYAPFNKTDQRRDSKNRKSQQDTWNEYVKKWKKLKDIDFIWIGETQILYQLKRDTPGHRGLVTYWFKEKVLTEEWFKKHIYTTHTKADRRYSQELNIETSTLEDLMKFTKSESSLEEPRETLNKIKGLYDSIRSNNYSINLPSDLNFLNNFHKLLDIYEEYLFSLMHINNDHKELSAKVKDGLYKLRLEEYQPQLDSQKKENGCSDKEHFNMTVSQQKISDLFYKLNSYIKCSSPKTILIEGVAGSGKTHLLCDLLSHSIENDEFISILFLGNCLRQNNLEQSILEGLNEFNSVDEFLETLNVYAKLKKQIAIFAIDGINEWESGKRNQIEAEVNLLKNKISKFSHIKFIISCRSEYLDDIFSIDFRQNIHRIRHQGFLSNSIDALHKFCHSYNIKPPSTPLLSPELSNPLILKTLCEAFKNQEAFPVSITGISNIFNAYINHLNEVLSKELDIDPDDKKIIQVIDSIAKIMYENNGKSGIPKAKIKESIKEIEVSSKWSESILRKLEKSGLIVLSKDYICLDTSGRFGTQRVLRRTVLSKDYIYLSYDRYRDFLTVNLILEDINEPKLIDTKKKLKEKIESFSSSYIYSGFIDFLSIAVPEKWGFELIDIYQGEKHDKYFLDNIIPAFTRSIAQREVSSISEQTEIILDKINHQEYIDYKEYYWQVFISCASIEAHPFNADYLHSKLAELSMADIDTEWTQFISLNYNNYFEEGYHNASNYFSLNSLLNPLLKLDNSKLTDKSIELITTLLLWLTTSTNKKLRNEASQACVNLLLKKEDLLIDLINKFKDIQDIYLQERLYVIAYGVVLFSENKKKIEEIATLIYANIFTQGIVYPNILIRDSAYGILKYAEHRGIDGIVDNDKLEHPYNYPQINSYPSDDCVKTNHNIPAGQPPAYVASQIYYSTLEPYHSSLSPPYRPAYVASQIYYSTSSQSDFMRYIVGDYFLDDWKNAPERNQMCNWLCVKAHSLGWDLNKHGKFDEKVKSGVGREEPKIERIGKKYQWIAFHEYICNLMDNYKYKERYVDDQPRQALIKDFARRRNFDPTFLISKKEEYSDWQNTFKYWTHTNMTNKKLFQPMSFDSQQKWLKKVQDDICKGSEIIDVKNEKNESFLVLRNSISQTENKYNNIESNYYRDFGLSLWSFICKKDDRDNVVNQIKEKFESGINGYSLFRETITFEGMHNLEYPWKNYTIDKHKFSCDYTDGKCDLGSYASTYLVNNLYVPSYKMLNALNLHQVKNKTYQWADKQNNEIFYNTYIENKKSDIPVVNKNNFINLLNKTDYTIIFYISTEKRLLTKDLSDLQRHPYMYYLTLYDIDSNNDIEEIYFGKWADYMGRLAKS